MLKFNILNKSVTLFLTSCLKNDLPYWVIDYTDLIHPIYIYNNNNYLECYRNQLVGHKAAIDLKKTINNHLLDLILEIIKDGYIIGNSNLGISFDIPLEIVENVFDFWFETYQDKLLWDRYIKLNKFRKSSNKFSYSMINALKGETSICMKKIEELYSFRPTHNSYIEKNKKFMW